MKETKSAYKVLKENLGYKNLTPLMNRPCLTPKEAIRAMEEFKNQFKGETNWEELRDRFFKDLTKEDSIDGTMFRIDKDPSDVFEWFKNQFKQDSKEAGIEQWRNTETQPLIIKEGNSWQVCEGVPDLFLAALQQRNIKDNTWSWWIRLCTIEDEIGLCVVCDDDNEPCGWEIEDIEYWKPVLNPQLLLNSNNPDIDLKK